MPTYKKPGRMIRIGIFFLIFYSVLAAQDDLLNDSVSVETDEPMAWALQFKVNDWLSLGPLYGGNVSVLHYTKPQSAIRFGLGLSAGMSTESEEDEDEEVSDVKGNSTSIIIQIHYLRFPKPSARGKVYWGGGPVLSACYSIEKEDLIEYGLEKKQIQRDYSIGVVGVLGYAWRVSQRIELFAEYQTELDLSYSYEESGVRGLGDFDQEIVEDRDLSIQPGATVLGLSLYF